MSVAMLLHGLFAGFVALSGAAALWRIARAARRLRRGRGALPPDALPAVHPAFLQPVSVLAIAREPGEALVERIRGLLALDHPELEVVVVVDEEAETLLPALEAAFAIEPFPEAHWRRLPARPVRAIYHAAGDARLRVIDKEPGGDADALNCALNASRFPLVCVTQHGTRLRTDALRRLVEPFVESPGTVASCAAGIEAAAPATRQVVALRALLAGVGGAAARGLAANAAGALVLRKDLAVAEGGFKLEPIDAVTELVLRLARSRGTPAAVRFVAEAICERDAVAPALPAPWTLADSEAVALAAAFAGILVLWLAGAIAGTAFLAFLVMAFALDVLVNVTALALEAAYFEQLLTRAPFDRLVLAALSAPAARAALRDRARWLKRSSPG